MTRKRSRKSFGALAVLIGLAGCQSARTTAAHKISDLLPRSLGPAAHYDAQVEGDTLALARGRARRIHVVGVQVQVAPHTTLDTLDIDAHDVTFDVDAQRIEQVGRATFTGTVGQTNLTEYLAHRQPSIPGLVVQLRARDVQAELPVSLGSLHETAEVSGTLAPDSAQPDHLDFVADAASLGRLPIPATLVNFALRGINPVFDLSQVKVPIALTGADVVNEQIVLQGTADLKDLQH